MNLSKQSLLGGTMLVFGGVTLIAMVQQSQPSDAKKQDIKEITQQEESATDSKHPKKDAVTLTAVDEEGKEVEKDQLAKDQLAKDQLAKDIATETKLAQTKKQQREEQAKAQEEQAKKFVEQQEKAKAAQQSKYKASSNNSKKAEENKKAVAKTKNISHPQVANRGDAIKKQQPTGAPGNNPTTYYAKKGDSMYKIAKDHGIKIEVLAEANDMYYLDTLMYGQKLIIPSKSQVAKLSKTAKKAQAKRAIAYQAKLKKEQERKEAARKKREEKRKAAEARIAKAKAAKAKALKAAKEKAAKAKAAKEKALKEAAKKKANKKSVQAKKAPTKKAPAKKAPVNRKTSAAQKKLQQARVTAKKENARGTFGVQVALAADQASADKVAAKFKKAGYRTKTSQTTRGVRVIVGPERGKVAALALKDKINSDPRTGVKNAWVLYWR